LFNRYARADSLEHPPRAVRGGKYAAFCPIDAASKGTWIGFNERGLFAAVTDQHTGEVGRVRRSRGRLILDLLLHFDRSSDAASYIEREAPRGYKKGNYVVADGREAFHIVYDGKVFRQAIDPGVYVVTNLTKLPEVKVSGEAREALEMAEMRKVRALQLAAGLESASLSQALAHLTYIASDHGGAPGRASICYHGSDDWRMTSSTIIAVAEKLGESRILYCGGNPCSSSFIDYSHVVSLSPVEVSGKSGKLAGRHIALCVTGSVAAIEAPKLARELRRHGAEVACYMTKAGIEYGVSPEVMRWATGRDVVAKLTGRVEHLEDYDLVVIYPATLNTVCKIASGVADNAVTTLCAATPADKLLIAPAMNLKLYSNPALKEAVAKLERLRATIVEPRVEEGAAKVAT
ncbi:TPA: hypothetical protein EYP13_03155, partial [Candidatus Micrarchaeota archaeon]|nr:hypothetical protein [Candidatus Micrarchaeota archaeon]